LEGDTVTDYPLPNDSNDLRGEVALVTGATSGLGWRFAQVLASAGARVVVTGRRVERLAELTELIAAGGGEALPLELDMMNSESITDVVEHAQAALGPVSILVNNAGVPDAQRAHKMSIELIDRVIDTNLRGPYILACEVARRLIEAKRPGRIVNISSTGAFHYAGHGAALYSITKAGIARMSEVLAVEWSRFHINVNCIAPGAFHSEMMDGMLERIGDISAGFPRKRIGDPAQLDSTLLYLCSPASECVTGSIVKVDDGQGPR
jgi:NAD(P)-dependent dehydrogenase (short-subunit alcohol dehydrogenase family)